MAKPEISWYRWAAGNVMPVDAIHEDNVLAKALPAWDEVALSHSELGALPKAWQAALAQWRGVYFIFDVEARSGYVGSACGADNLLGRWKNYGASGHGGNVHLIARDPSNFRFSILELVSPSMPERDVIALENSWKRRLYTRAPHGLNDN